MPTIPNRSQTTRVLPEAGSHIARVIEFIYMGTIEDEYLGEKKKSQKIRLKWELPESLHVFKEGDDAKPLVHSQEFTLSMGKKSNLRPIVEGIVGTSLDDEEAYGFDVEKLLNLPCLISIKRNKTQKGVEYAKIASTAPLMKGQVCKDAFNPLRVLNYAEKWDEAFFQSLPIFIRERMQSSEEYKALKGLTDEVKEVDADEIPF